MERSIDRLAQESGVTLGTLRGLGVAEDVLEDFSEVREQLIRRSR